MNLMENKYNELTQYVPKSEWGNCTKQQYIYKKLTDRLNWLESIFAEIVDNAFISTANEERIKELEKEFGIIPDPSQTLDDRKATLLSNLRGIGVTNIARIKNVVESFTNGKVDVITDNSNYSFTIKFVDKAGVPPRIKDVQKAIDKIKPAHLDYKFEFKYNTWGDIINNFDSWDEVMDYFLNWEEVKDKPINKAEIVKKYRQLYYFDDTTKSYKKLTFK